MLPRCLVVPRQLRGDQIAAAGVAPGQGVGDPRMHRAQPRRLQARQDGARQHGLGQTVGEPLVVTLRGDQPQRLEPLERLLHLLGSEGRLAQGEQRRIGRPPDGRQHRQHGLLDGVERHLREPALGGLAEALRDILRPDRPLDGPPRPGAADPARRDQPAQGLLEVLRDAANLGADRLHGVQQTEGDLVAEDRAGPGWNVGGGERIERDPLDPATALEPLEHRADGRGRRGRERGREPQPAGIVSGLLEEDPGQHRQCASPRRTELLEPHEHPAVALASVSQQEARDRLHREPLLGLRVVARSRRDPLEARVIGQQLA